MTGRLHGVRHPGEVSARQALAWFTGSAGQVIGYLLAADRAEWFRCRGAVPHGPEAARDLTAAFEVVATDRERHLRWWHTLGGLGNAVSLSEDPGLLPPGTGLPAHPERIRLDGVATRLLGGLTAGPGDGWVTLTSARYAPCQVPVTAEAGQEVWADLAEYVVGDEHGNVSVADTVLVGLRAGSPQTSRGRRTTGRSE
jgi:hypothetical protein